MARTKRDLDKKDSSLMFREITPPHGWKEDSDFHYLRLTLPGFEAKDVTIRMDKYGHLVVRGTRQVTEHKYISFEETFDVPDDGNLEDAEGLFENDQIYLITIPKHKQGQRTGHTISMPKEENRPVHKHGSNTTIVERPEVSLQPPRIPKDPLNKFTRDKSKRKIAFFVALLIALLVVAVVLVVKFHRR